MYKEQQYAKIHKILRIFTKREKETKNQETPMDIQDRLNGLARKQIFNKVQERIKMSEQAAKKLRTQSVEKERLIKENEKGTFCRYNGNQLIRI